MTLIARITALINVVASDIKNLFQNKQDKIKKIRVDIEYLVFSLKKRKTVALQMQNHK